MATNEQKIIFYGHETCPMVPPIWGMLKQSRADFEYINIHQNEAGREHVRQINNGNESVPTLVFPDGTTLTEPAPTALRDKLIEDGYSVSFLAMIWGYGFQIILGLVILLALLNFLGVI